MINKILNYIKKIKNYFKNFFSFKKLNYDIEKNLYTIKDGEVDIFNKLLLEKHIKNAHNLIVGKSKVSRLNITIYAKSDETEQAYTIDKTFTIFNNNVDECIDPIYNGILDIKKRYRTNYINSVSIFIKSFERDNIEKLFKRDEVVTR